MGSGRMRAELPPIAFVLASKYVGVCRHRNILEICRLNTRWMDGRTGLG